MPNALCSNFNCDYNIKLHGRLNGLSRTTPQLCPRCKSSMLSRCPQCGFLLTGRPGTTVCGVCKADIRRVFTRLGVRPQVGALIRRWQALIGSKVDPIVHRNNYILVALRQTGGNRLAAAHLLGIGKTTLYRKLRQYARGAAT